MPMMKKAFAMLMVSLFIMFVSLFLIARTISTNLVKTIEVDGMEENVNRITKAVDREVSSLDIKFRDWSSWDDMYRFAKDENPEFVESNLSTSTMVTGEFNIAAVIGTDGRYIFKRAVNLDYEADMDVSPEEWDRFRVAVDGMRKKSPDGARGIFRFDGRPSMIVVLPILTSEQKGPARGFFIAGKLINPSIIQQVANDLALPLNLWPVNDRFLPPEVIEAYKKMIGEKKTLVDIMDQTTIAGYARIDDINGAPALIAVFHQTREINTIARHGFTGLMFICSMISLFILAPTIIFMHYKVSLPLKRVISEIISVANSSDHSQRISIEKSSDFRRLSESINSMIAALETSQEALIKIRKAVESSSDAIGMADPSGRHFFQNKAFTDMLEYSVEDLSRQDMPLSAYEDPEVGLEVFSTIMSGKSWKGEIMMKSKSGRCIPVSARADAIKDEKGNIIGLVGIHTDISERRKVEQMKSDFIANVSHELRTPLTSLRGSLGLLSSGVMGELNEEIKELIDVARFNAERLTRLINDILDLQKMDSGTLHMEIKNVCLDEIIRNSISEMTSSAHARNVKIVMEPMAFRVCADCDRMIQVMDNLIANSIKFSPFGSEVKIFAVPESDFVRVFVQDRGTGVPDEFVGKIFERFQQADASSTRKNGGTGLGLSICKNIIEHHGGEIRYEPTPGGGATFSFTLKTTCSRTAAASRNEVA